VKADRYNEGTLARMRAEYVIPLQGDVQVATSTAHRKRLQKELTKLTKQQVELLAFDEKLRHYADKRITLYLDDGVKVNYGKFADLLPDEHTALSKKPEALVRQELDALRVELLESKLRAAIASAHARLRDSALSEGA